MRQRLLLGMGVGFAIVLLILIPITISVASPPTPPTPTATTMPTDTVPGANCTANPPVFQRYQLGPDDNRFGEGLNLNDPNNDFNHDGAVDKYDVQIYLHYIRSLNPAIVASHTGYVGGAPVDPAALLATTQFYIDNPQKWCDAIAVLEVIESKCASMELADMSGAYRTEDMLDTQPIPELHEVDPDRPHYVVLRFSQCPDGHEYNYKIDCLFQPVGTFPPVAPPTSPPAGCTENCSPITVPRCTHDCSPTTTIPHTTTTSGCSTGPNGCKPNVPLSPGQCAQPDQNCQPGVGSTTPRPADPVQPTPTVAPPVNPPPPTEAPPPPNQPPQGPATTIGSAPS